LHRGFVDEGFHSEATWQRGLFLLLIVIALVVGAVVLFRMWAARPTRPGHLAPPPSSAALAELDLRYARGEVAREEYLQRRADLLGHAAAPPAATLAAAPPATPPPSRRGGSPPGAPPPAV
jgi:putative membrane protein